MRQESETGYRPLPTQISATPVMIVTAVQGGTTKKVDADQDHAIGNIVADVPDPDRDQGIGIDTDIAGIGEIGLVLVIDGDPGHAIDTVPDAPDPEVVVVKIVDRVASDRLVT